MATTDEYRKLAAAEATDMADFVESLEPAQLDAPSLCEGWRVRDVLAHLYGGATFSLASHLTAVARHGFSVPRASKANAIAIADRYEAFDMAVAVRRFAAEYAAGGANRGIVRLIKPRDLLVDQLVHHQDIRRPLGLPRAIPLDRLTAALDAAPAVAGFVKAKGRAKGLLFVATDLDWHAGSGPLVRGPGEAILLALTGRPALLNELTGDGVDVLRKRL